MKDPTPRHHKLYGPPPNHAPALRLYRSMENCPALGRMSYCSNSLRQASIYDLSQQTKQEHIWDITYRCSSDVFWERPPKDTDIVLNSTCLMDNRSLGGA